MTPTSS